eukprot:9501700-Pyramimonas_sp.AAC.1
MGGGSASALVCSRGPPSSGRLSVGRWRPCRARTRGWAGLERSFHKSVHSTGHELRGWPDVARGHVMKCPWSDTV